MTATVTADLVGAIMRRLIALLFALLGFAALYAVLADVTDVYSTSAQHSDTALQKPDHAS
jgi:uncharacterized membrane protein YuzA (DUF378 family)